VGGPSLQVFTEPSVDLTANLRLVTVLFADISGSTTLGELLDPEDLRRVLTDFFGALAREVKRFGGTVDKYIGDAVMAVFGAPQAHEDDAERAISAAIAMQVAIGQLNEDLERRHGTRLALRIGINTGEVVAGLLAGDVQAYTVVGDTVNTAQRFEAAAAPGSILVGQATRELTRRAFDFETLEPLIMKGKADPQPAFRVQGPRYESIDPSAVALVGRDRELAALRGALAESSAGRGAMVHLVGDAGIGKSRLVRELRMGMDSEVVQVVGRCVSFEVDRPYALLARLIRDVVRVPTGNDEHTAHDGIERVLAAIGPNVDPLDSALLLDVLGYGERSAVDPQSRQRVLLRLLLHLLEAYSEISPVLIVADDLHWADPVSQALLSDLARDIPNRRCMLLSTGRPGSVPPWPAQIVALEALPQSGARELIESAFAAPVEDSLVETILARTGGNPFFIEEVVRGLREADVVAIGATGRVSARPGATPRVPTTVQEVLEARLDRLTPSAKRVLQVAAVCGRVFRQRVVERLVPDVVRSDSLGFLERESFILTQAMEPEQTYVFRHALIQEVAYHGQLNATRRVTHAAIGEALEAIYADRLDELVSELAFHYGQSHNDQKALFWLVRAGDRAKALYANAEALGYYEAALERAPDGEGALEAGTLLERIGEVQSLVGRYDDAIASFRQALERIPTPSPGTVARLQRRSGTTLLLKSAYAEAAVAFSAGLAALGDANDIEAARIGVQFGHLQFRRGDLPAARTALVKAVELGSRLNADDLVADGLQQLGNVIGQGGDLRGAIEVYERSRAIHERRQNLSGIAEVRNNLGTAYRRLARWNDALSEYDTCLALWERIGNPWGVALSHNNIGEVHRSRGDLVRGIASYERALALFQSLGAANEAAVTLIGLGAARVELGRTAQGRLDLVEAAAQLEALGSHGYLADAYRYLASAELIGGDLVAAERAGQRSLANARASTARHQEAATLRVLGEIALASGAPASARTLLEQSRKTLSGLGDTLELAKTDAVLARLTRT
jgi:class 3 adenylate cyclase/tetratricopeptide (TPR) repeat protein